MYLEFLIVCKRDEIIKYENKIIEIKYVNCFYFRCINDNFKDIKSVFD